MTAIYRYSGPDPLRTMAIYRYSGPDPLRTNKNGLRHGDYFFEDKGILPGCFVIERQP